MKKRCVYLFLSDIIPLKHFEIMNRIWVILKIHDLPFYNKSLLYPLNCDPLPKQKYFGRPLLIFILLIQIGHRKKTKIKLDKYLFLGHEINVCFALLCHKSNYLISHVSSFSICTLLTSMPIILSLMIFFFFISNDQVKIML